MVDQFASLVAARTMDLLKQQRALLHSTGTVFWLRPLRERLVIIFDPAEIVLKKVDDAFAHDLSTLLHGRRVICTNTRGLYLQVSYTIPPHVDLTAQPLDLAQQPTPCSLPIGITARGPLWIELQQGDSFLVGGVRGMGKSGMLHGFIQALLHGGQTLIYAWDGKDNAEYLRYYGRQNFHLLPIDDLQAGLQKINQEVTARMRRLTQSGHANIVTYNTAFPGGPILPIALVIDEIAEIQDQSNLLHLVKVYRAAGVHPIFATNDPSKAAVVAKSNLGTRISFPVVSYNDSTTILGHVGANKLEKVRGRGLIEHGGRLVEFQSFTVTYPPPSTEALDWLAQQVQEGDQQDGKKIDGNDAQVMALIEQGEGDPAIVRLVWHVTGGSRFYQLKDRVATIRQASSSSKISPFDQNLAAEAA